MTCIVGVSDGTRVCVASDSQTTDNGHRLTIEHKVHRHCDVIIGADGRGSLMDLFRYCSPPKFSQTENLAAWAFRDLVPWMLGEFERRSMFDEDRAKGWPFPGSMILAWKSDVLIVALDGQVIRPERMWCAIGSGRAVASGAIWQALQSEHWQADQVARAGVEAACEMDSGCGLPVRHYWTRP